MCQSFERHFKTRVSPRTVRRWLKSAHVTYRSIGVRPRVHRGKRRFYQQIKGVPVERLLSVDEMGFGYGFIHQKRIWQHKGGVKRHWSKSTPFERYNKTVTCLIDCKQVIHYEWSLQPMNTRRFAEFLRMSLYGYAGFYIILDNVAFHKSRMVHRVLTEFGVTPIYIDPYTPEQNPIEEVFSSVKAYVKQRSPRDHLTFDRTIRRAMCVQSKESLTKCFHRSASFRV